MSPERIATQVDGRELSLSNLEKVFYPESGFTKGEMLHYYANIAPIILPHITQRPATLKRFPNGVDGTSFFEKHAPRGVPDWVRTAEVLPSSGTHPPIEFVVIDDRPTLMWVANLAAIELHVPMWRIDEQSVPQFPDLMVFDLDPGPGTTIVECCQVAQWIADRCRDWRAFPKTSGSKGLQLYFALSGIDSDEARNQAHDIARAVEHDHEDAVVSNMRKDLRDNKVLIDWSQNHRAKTTVAVYSMRARPEPTVSAPVTWDEIEACINSKNALDLRFTATDVLERVTQFGDLFAGLNDHR